MENILSCLKDLFYYSSTNQHQYQHLDEYSSFSRLGFPKKFLLIYLNHRKVSLHIFTFIGFRLLVSIFLNKFSIRTDENI